MCRMCNRRVSGTNQKIYEVRYVKTGGAKVPHAIRITVKARAHINCSCLSRVFQSELNVTPQTEGQFVIQQEA